MKKKIFLSLMSMWLFIGCTKDLDWEKAENFSSEQIWEATVFEAEITAEHLYADSLAFNRLSDTIHFELLDKNLFKRGFKKIVLEMYAINTLPADFEFQMSFWKDGQWIYSADFLEISAGTQGRPTEMVVTDTIYQTEKPDFLNFNDVVLILFRKDTTDLRGSEGKLVIGLNFSLYLQLE